MTPRPFPKFVRIARALVFMTRWASCLSQRWWLNKMATSALAGVVREGGEREGEEGEWERDATTSQTTRVLFYVHLLERLGTGYWFKSEIHVINNDLVNVSAGLIIFYLCASCRRTTYLACSRDTQQGNERRSSYFINKRHLHDADIAQENDTRRYTIILRKRFQAISDNIARMRDLQPETCTSTLFDTLYTIKMHLC